MPVREVIVWQSAGVRSNAPADRKMLLGYRTKS